MPTSKKRKVEEKPVVEEKHFSPSSSKAGKILILVLCVAMVLGILFAAVYLMITAL